MTQADESSRDVESESNGNGVKSAWSTLLPHWQCCIEQAWISYCKGSLPIGAAITNEDGHLLARGRNRMYEDAICEDEQEKQILRGHRLAHAEMNALLQVNWREVNPKKCILYTTTEPCPLCVGAVRLTRIRTVYYASKDTGAGSANLFTANEFMQRAKIQVTGPEHTDMETILTAMLVEILLRRKEERMSLLYEEVEKAHPSGAHLGKKLFENGKLDRWKEQGCSVAYTYEQVALLLHHSEISPA